MKGWKGIVVAVAALSLLAVACGDDDDDDSGTTTTAASESTAAPETTAAAAGDDAATDDAATDEAATDEMAMEEGCVDGAEPIKIGAITQTANFPGMEDGILAVVERENQTCIGGRPLEFVGLEDDGSDAQRNLELARQLVEQEGVFAIVATSSVLLPATTDYLAEQGIPYFGWGFMPGFCGEGSTGYGFNGCLSGFALGASTNVNAALRDPIAEAVGKPADEMTVVILNSDNDAGRFGDLQYVALFGEEQILADEFVPVGGAADPTQYVNLVLENNPDAVMLSTDFVTTVPLKAALIQAGYEGVVFDYTTYIPGLLDASADTAAALEGGYSLSQIPPNEDGTPAVEQIAADLAASGSELPFATQGASIGYWSTDLMAQMLHAVAHEGEITSETFFSVIEDGGFTSEAVEGGLGPISFPEGHFELSPCSALVRVEDGEFTSVVPFTCYERIPVG